MKRIAVVLSFLLALSLGVCALADTAEPIGQKTWAGEIIEHGNFRDLGSYVIEMPEYTDPAVEAKGLAELNRKYELGQIPFGGCTCVMTTNSKGEVISGRNMDIEVSQYPAYLFRASFGKYKTLGVSYLPGQYKPYEELKKDDKIDEAWFNSLIYQATDCLNEKGLYIQSNLREANERLINDGLHTAHGETTREDGTPWSELRVCALAIPLLVAQNCATVDEAIAFLNNSYDWYTIFMPNNSHYSLINFGYMIGDATGKYGLIEVAQDEVRFLPYQYGQANYYLSPKWDALDPCGVGVGRLEMAGQLLGGLETLEDAMNMMQNIMWRNETLWLGESVRAKDDAHQNPWNQIVFRDDKGNPVLDWRSDFAGDWPVLEDGRLVAPRKLYEDACKSTYDPKIKEYFDDAIASGWLVLDDGSMTFDCEGKQVPIAELKEKFDQYMENYLKAGLQNELRPYYLTYLKLLTNQGTEWSHDDHHFEAMKAMAYARMHIRYNAQNEVDPTAMSKYEKALAFYGLGVEKNEKPLRDDASIWTTSVNIGVNCAERKMKLLFWENNDLIYEMGF